MTFLYIKENGSREKRIVKPIEIRYMRYNGYQPYRYYLIAYDYKRQANRNFREDRIFNVEEYNN
ncbi:WYL domain-containing protein [Marispirochaeta aestuarii]|uniref:WYL domain-containing protein n=1 Tax=Marispirochaeta aestuarii TaxID=1963862 RepID=UPI0038B2A5F1